MKWATRTNIHVDRAACAWLNRRPSTPTPSSFLLADPTEVPADATPFDLRGVELGHHNGDCSFETILRRYELTDPALWRIAEIIHEADLDDERYDARSTRPRHRPTRPIHDQHRRTDPHPHRASLRGPLRVLPPSDAARPRTRIARLSPGQSASLADPPGPEGETAVHVELEFALHRHMCPDQRGQPAVVRRRESRRQLGSVEDVLDHEGVDLDHGRLHDVQKQHGHLLFVAAVGRDVGGVRRITAHTRSTTVNGASRQAPRRRR
jgi:hypothetical protein